MAIEVSPVVDEAAGTITVPLRVAGCIASRPSAHIPPHESYVDLVFDLDGAVLRGPQLEPEHLARVWAATERALGRAP